MSKKYKCYGCGLCCKVKLERHPVYCMLYGVRCNWKEVKEETITNSSQLPKLTEEVFDSPDCPDWARYAAVDSDGSMYFYGQKPSHSVDKWHPITGDECRWMADLYFDPSDWQNSLIEHLTKSLPEWCKEGEWVYYFDEVEGHSYQKIDKIDGKYIYFYKKFDSSKPSDPFVSDRVVYSVFIENTKQARLRPYNAEEMRGLVGKVVENGVRAMLVLSYRKDLNKILTDDRSLYAEQILTDCTIDGKPCGVLEHLENGEWVK